MGRVDQPLLSIATPAPGHGAMNSNDAVEECAPSSLRTRRFLDRRGRFQQSLGTFKCVVAQETGDW